MRQTGDQGSHDDRGQKAKINSKGISFGFARLFDREAEDGFLLSTF